MPARFSGTALLFICDALITVFAFFLDRYAPVLLSPSRSPFFLHFYSSLLPLFLYTSVLTPVHITTLVSATKHALFPNGYVALSPPDPTPEEQAVLRSELLRRLSQAIPGARIKGHLLRPSI